MTGGKDSKQYSSPTFICTQCTAARQRGILWAGLSHSGQILSLVLPTSAADGESYFGCGRPQFIQTQRN